MRREELENHDRIPRLKKCFSHVIEKYVNVIEIPRIKERRSVVSGANQ